MRVHQLLTLLTMTTLRVACSFARDLSLKGGSRLGVTSLKKALENPHISPRQRYAHKAGARDSLAETSKTGEFLRRDSAWRNWISRGKYSKSNHIELFKTFGKRPHESLPEEKDERFQPEKDRYHLFVAYACPWAHRTLITRALKGLEDTVSVTVVHPIWQKTRPGEDDHRGWIFGNPNGEQLSNTDGRGGPFPSAYSGNDVDPFFGYQSVRDYYDHVGDTEGKYTVPILWDKKLNTIVSNESAEIIRMLNAEFNDFAKNPDLNLYPDYLKDKIDAVNEWIYPKINNGVYRCGFAKSQQAYDKAITELTESFDELERILQKQRYIAGDEFTEADIRLFVTLLRFDEVYVVYFKTNTRSVAQSPAILNYCRMIYQMPGVKETVDMEQIKTHYFCSHPELNHYSVIPKGNDFIKLLEEPHTLNELL